ncbi:PTS system beta-glucosides-specific IIC component [Arcanobacterium pluranimalium]|uniref:glucose PTS transporter subunit IIA n=1 Tax=Arcanobacterium pluranimalium TaxID=108028 RepID=UPI00195BCB31|nr:glucose PTS transporter subunit IIA [Arcanobacterium pluranimalium]MBM7824915.1 PTS system beta-glucosides-specific IIC component [Arcanobacterium pluranimalium]
MSNETRVISPAQQIIDAIGGSTNVKSLTHCATRLRFELVDASKVNREELEKIDGVLGVVPQSGERYQVVAGGGVATLYNEIKSLPSMAKTGKQAAKTDAEIKAEARSKARGRFGWVDAFFEFLSDSFRPILGVLLGASLIIAFASILDAFEIIKFRDDTKSSTWVFVDAMWHSVFFFLPLMVAYNASKKLRVDPWLGTAVMGALMTPEFVSLSDPKRFPNTVCQTNDSLGTKSCVAEVFGIHMPLHGYSGQVFVPLMMVGLLALVYRGLKKIFPENLQMVFVPFFSMIIMIPVTAFLIGPLGVVVGNGLGSGLAWLNGHAPIVFAVLIPVIYPFLVPLGLHWPLNALMLVNIQTLGYDFIQGPMGAWNFACFGATAGVLVLSIRHKETVMRQVSIGALAAGLLGGISEPSLYGIHLRFKRIYPRMLVGCLAGGIVIGLTGGVTTGAFAFTSLLTIPVFTPVWRYTLGVMVAFVVAMVLIIISDFRTPEERAAFKAEQEAEAAAQGADDASSDAQPESRSAVVADETTGSGVVENTETTTDVLAPVAGSVVALDKVGDAVFASGVLGAGVGINPENGTILAPISGTVASVQKSGHAFGIKSDDGVEVLVHVGIDTVNMQGKGFDVRVEKGARVESGDVLVEVDLQQVTDSGFATTTIVTVTNTKSLTSVEPIVPTDVQAGEKIISVTR